MPVIDRKETYMKLRTNPAKGTQDILPEDMALRIFVQDVIRNTYMEKGFMEIQTPSIESIELLTNSDGGENLRMLFKILKRGEKLDLTQTEEEKLVDLGLRFDLTLPLSRYYANNRGQLPMPFKAIQMGDVWRGEKPQKGRYRQFMQCDVDIIGDPSIVSEVELLTTVPEAIKRLGFDNFEIKINDRRILKYIVSQAGIEDENFESVCISLDKADKIGIEGVKMSFCKNISPSKIEALVDNMSMELSQIDIDAARSIERIISIVSKYYPISFDATLVRGMGYYTGAIFEIQSNEFKGSLGGGGRYDTLLNKFQNDPIPAVGFSIGFERIVDLLKTKEIKVSKKKNVPLYL